MLDTRAYDGTKQGYRLVYRPSKVNCCPGCGHTNWYVGRSSAECAFCATALPLQQTGGADYLTDFTARAAA
ncbi:hypothetical protein [Sphingosinicella soli]|uniref:Ribosomal protein S27E n=1 Tax=Sphingosinicella soli TaxID=333708 RepID=A0A7W7AZN0_9SPHN|nr:hypothetical protein [Sphingosinicella soli]MBB4631139.1 ribosomal protein S27E [Sphingosinicella soli]